MQAPADASLVESCRGDDWRLRFDLLREQVAAEGDAAIERDGCEVGAAAALALDPGADRRGEATNRRPHRVEHAEVNADGANLAAILRPVGAEAQELDHSMEVLARGWIREPSNIL